MVVRNILFEAFVSFVFYRPSRPQLLYNIHSLSPCYTALYVLHSLVDPHPRIPSTFHSANVSISTNTWPAYPTFSLDIPSFASQCCPSATSAFTRIPSKHVFGFDLWALCVCDPYSVLQRFRQGAQDKGHPSCVFRLGKRRRRVQDQMEGRYQPLDRLPRRFRR